MKRSAMSLVSLGVALLASPAQASNHGWSQASDVGRDLLVAAALGVPAVQADWTGDVQGAASILVAGGAAYGLKQIFPEERPDQSNRKSFPSGHSAVSFAAAASLENRYGWKLGIPAFAVATFVGTARVEARKHHWYDCVVGAAIGSGSGFLMTSRRNDRVRLVPWAAAGGGGMIIAARF